jgi:hypothetical protein
MDSYIDGVSQIPDLDLIRIPVNEIEEFLSQDVNEDEVESPFQPTTPNLGNVFVGSSGAAPPPSKAPATTGVIFADRSESQNLLFMGGDPRASEGASSLDGEVEVGPSEWWDQLLAAGVLPPDVVASGTRVTDEVLMGLFPQASVPVNAFQALEPVHQIPVPIQQQQGPPQRSTARRMEGCIGSRCSAKYETHWVDSTLPFQFTTPSCSHRVSECQMARTRIRPQEASEEAVDHPTPTVFVEEMSHLREEIHNAGHHHLHPLEDLP